MKLGIECDGFEHHSARRSFERDRRRRTALTSMGWRVLQVTWDDLASRPTSIAETVERALHLGRTG